MAARMRMSISDPFRSKNVEEKKNVYKKCANSEALIY